MDAAKYRAMAERGYSQGCSGLADLFGVQDANSAAISWERVNKILSELEVTGHKGESSVAAQAAKRGLPACFISTRTCAFAPQGSPLRDARATERRGAVDKVTEALETPPWEHPALRSPRLRLQRQ